MRARVVVALAVLCGCSEEPRIRAERFVHAVERERTDLVQDRRGAVLWLRESELPPALSECEPGELRSCVPSPRGAGRQYGPFMHCVRAPDGGGRWATAECNTPLVVAWGDGPVAFTRPPGSFPIGVSERTEWVSARTPWLALDRDGSGCIETSAELFAGFSELAALDDDGDGRIDARDAAFASLVLWSDRDQDRRCTPDELEPLADHGIAALDLAYVVPPHGGLGSFEGERAPVSGGGVTRGRLVDVYLAPLP